MDLLRGHLRSRILPAVLTATGIALVTAGLLTYSTPVDAGPVVLTSGPTSAPSSSAPPSVPPSFSLLTLPPFPTPSDGPSSSPATRVTTRVVVPALGIDLPVVKPPAGFPFCNVAMYLDLFSQPGEPGATYLFAHARTGMFLPLLTRSEVSNGASMIGMLVELYTSDDQLFLYRVVEVRRHYPADRSLSTLQTKDDQVWLQTSEGPYASSPKLQVVADLLSSGPADAAQAHPTPHPIVCA